MSNRSVSSIGVVVLYNLPAQPIDGGAPVWAESDQGVLNEVEAVAAALKELGIPAAPAGVHRLGNIAAALQAYPGRIVFNLVERLDGVVADFNFVPAVCTALGHACTGSGAACLSLTLDKWLTKARLDAFGVATPAGAVVPPGAPITSVALPLLPLIVKPLCTDGSEGIDAASVVRSPAELAAAVGRVHAQCAQAALVEQFVEGREFNLSLLERAGRVEVLPLAEIDFSLFPPGRPHIVDYAVKWIPGTIPGRVSPRHFPSVDEDLGRRLRAAALRAWEVCECRDYVRIDFRVDAAGRPLVLEVNANPDISPKAGFPAALAAGGVPFVEFVRQVLANVDARGRGLP